MDIRSYLFGFSLVDSNYGLVTMPVVMYLFYAHVVNNSVSLGAHSKWRWTAQLLTLHTWLAFICRDGWRSFAGMAGVRLQLPLLNEPIPPKLKWPWLSKTIAQQWTDRWADIPFWFLCITSNLVLQIMQRTKTRSLMSISHFFTWSATRECAQQ